MKKTIILQLSFIGAMLFVDSSSTPFLLPFVFAHCDTLAGPVVKTAQAALEKGDVTPILKWVKKENEMEIRDLFKKTQTVRSKGKEAQELADMYFLETLVRLHRAGEGEAYTGLKPACIVEPAVVEADKALQSGSVKPGSACVSIRDEALIEPFRGLIRRALAETAVNLGAAAWPQAMRLSVAIGPQAGSVEIFWNSARAVSWARRAISEKA